VQRLGQLLGEANEVAPVVIFASATHALIERGKAITSITVATSVVPVVGTILVLLAEWVLSELPGVVTPGACDGLVALEQDVLYGTDIALGTAGGKVHSVTTEHPGTNSADGCGANSKYQVQWSIRQV